MGACQNEFHNVPDATDEEAQDALKQSQHYQQLARARDTQVIRSGSIKQQHKNVRPNSKEIDFGMIDRDRLKSQYLSQVAKRQTLSPTTVKPFSAAGQDQSNNFGLLIESRELDRQQLHQTVRPYKDEVDQKIEIGDEDQQQLPVEERERVQLRNYEFYYSLGLPEYVYPPIPTEHKKDYEDLMLGQQEQRYGVKYIGQWKDGKIHGNGVLQSNTVKYIGQFKKGIKWFHGREIQQEEVYEGEFQNGRRRGKGIRYTPDLTEEGEFDVYLLQGKVTYSNGDWYEGELKNNKFHGEGRFIENIKGITYTGRFRAGMLVEGKIQYTDGRYYEGTLENGLKNGHGYFYWDDDNIYKGEYRNGKKHGEGTLLRNGRRYKGRFENGELKQAEREDLGESQLSKTEGESLPNNWKDVLG